MTTQPRHFASLLKRIFIVLFISVPCLSYAQTEAELINFLDAGKRDASKLMGAYLSPMVEGLSYSFNGGWYHTAKAHNSLGFDLGISVNAVFVPQTKNYFTPSTLGLENTQLVSPISGKAPTVMGPADPTTYLTSVDLNGDGTIDQTVTIDGPEGVDFKENFKVSGVVAPTAQLGIGIYKNTDLKIRWMPEVKASDSRVRLFGLGVLHDIKQHIPGIKTLPFDLSVLVAFTNINGSTLTSIPEFPKPSSDPRPQIMDYNMKAWLFQALISKKFSVVTFYGGIGYNTIKTTADLTGSYILVANPEISLKDPLSLGYNNKSFKVTAGVRLKLGPIYLNGDYSLQEYNTLSVGLGVAVR